MARKTYLLLVTLSVSLALGATPLPAQDKGCPTGGEGGRQLVQALDAGFVRVLDPLWRAKKGKPSYWDILAPIADKQTAVFDCYPYEQYTLFPEKPEGLLKCILEKKKIRVGHILAGPDCRGSWNVTGSVTQLPDGSVVAEGPSAEILRAIVDEIGDHYGKPIEIEWHFFGGGDIRGSLFTPLLDDRVDMIDLIHALGAASAGKLRRDIALFTCTILANAHILLVREKDWETKKYRTLTDVVLDPDARICAGPLDTHTSRSLFLTPQQGKDPKETRIKMADCDDVEACVACVKGELKGEKRCDAFFHWDRTLEVPGLKAIRTGISGGVPYWVKP
jgi:hypothetical protein